MKKTILIALATFVFCIIRFNDDNTFNALIHDEGPVGITMEYKGVTESLKQYPEFIIFSDDKGKTIKLLNMPIIIEGNAPERIQKRKQNAERKP